MPQDIYSILALACRYWFAFLGVLIVWRSFSWLRKDRRQTHRRLKTLPDAGMIGELFVLQGSDELPEDSFLPVPREGTLGFLRTCDIVVPVSGVERQHIDFVFLDGQGLRAAPRRGCSIMIDGQLITDRRQAAQFPMRHGSLLTVGDAILKLRLFAGLDAPYPAEYLPDDPQQQSPDEAMPGYPPPYGAPAYPPYPAPPPGEDAPVYPPYAPPAYPPYPPQEQAYSQQPNWPEPPMNRRYHDEA